MSSASWTPSINGSTATWDENKTLADRQRNAILYNDSTVTYNSPLVYYNGYDPTGTTPEGESGALWNAVAE